MTRRLGCWMLKFIWKWIVILCIFLVVPPSVEAIYHDMMVQLVRSNEYYDPVALHHGNGISVSVHRPVLMNYRLFPMWLFHVAELLNHIELQPDLLLQLINKMLWEKLDCYLLIKFRLISEAHFMHERSMI